MRLSQKSADHTTAYYQAENLANDILININHCIIKNLGQKDEKIFLKNIRSELDGKDGISFIDDSTLTWTVPLTENQYLKAEITISCEPLTDGKHYEILSWNTYTNYDWGADESLPLLEGDAFPDMLTEEYK